MSASVQTFRSNGKLMISGEYLVMAGARALAIPLRFGQSMSIESRDADQAELLWISRVKEQEWFRFSIKSGVVQIHDAASEPSVSFIASLLKRAAELNPGFLNRPVSEVVTANIEFDLAWGLGSSSTLVSNIAWWADVDPYTLLFNSMGGSGYDIACARSPFPLIYQLQDVDGRRLPYSEPLNFYPSFSSNIWFVYTGRKQSSSKELARFDTRRVSEMMIMQINEITHRMASAGNPDEFMDLMSAHEEILSTVLDREPVKASLFPDFPGAVKSLGAWGGDFVMAVSVLPAEQVRRYFENKGLKTIFAYQELVLTNQYNQQA